MNRILSLAALGLPLVFTLACGSNSPDATSDRLAPTCELVEEKAALTWFDKSGSLHWTADAIAQDGSMTVRYCDGDVARAVRITGLSAGDAVDWQQGAMTDGNRRVIHVADITTTVSNVPVAAKRLEGVTLQCIPPLGSCAPKPEKVEKKADAAPAATKAAAPATVDTDANDLGTSEADAGS